jgi:hypothetical protein
MDMKWLIFILVSLALIGIFLFKKQIFIKSQELYSPVEKQLVNTYQDGEVTKCTYDGAVYYSAGYNVYDGGWRYI